MDNFEEMHGGVYQPDPNKDAAKELKRRSKMLQIAMDALEVLAAQGNGVALTAMQGITEAARCSG